MVLTEARARTRSGGSRRVAAFTLIEVVLVIVLVTTLTLAGASRMTTAVAGSSLLGDAHRLQMRLLDLRQRAFVSGLRHQVVFSPSTASYQLLEQTSGTFRVFETDTLSPGVELVSTSLPSNLLEYAPRGRAVAGGSVWLAMEQSTRRLDIATGSGFVSSF
jgi:type II secretory pathway pseudopilin PulG